MRRGKGGNYSEIIQHSYFSAHIAITTFKYLQHFPDSGCSESAAVFYRAWP